MHVLSGELRKEAFEKQLDGSYMFVIELSEYQKDKNGDAIYTNYKAAFFAKSQGEYDRYKKAFQVGNFVTVNAEKLKIEVSECGQYTKLDMCFPRLSEFKDCSQQQQPQQGGFAPQQQGGFAPQGGFSQG